MENEEPWLCEKEPVWIHVPPKFLKGVIKDIYKDIITCSLESGDTMKLKKSDVYHRNPLPPDINQTDLMQIDIINEPEILQLLTGRFQERKIYTYVENTLIAVNPFTPIPELYTDELKDFYINQSEQKVPMKECSPHVYSITAEMVKCLFMNRKNQSILISGESGAGKTEANKECLRFLTACFQKMNKSPHSENNIERTIILSNPILEAFGNSKTIRNNNSSRFGKYLSIMISPEEKEIKNAEIFNYLLEKSRIISRSREEQNFHVFYEFLEKTTPQEKLRYHLVDDESCKYLTFQDFNYTANPTQKEYQGNPDVSFSLIRESMGILPDNNAFDYLCRILSAILHIGNLECEEKEDVELCEIYPKSTFEVVCELLQVDQKMLHDSLTSYNIKVGGEQTLKCFSKRAVQELIHSLSKTLYERLFQWIINEINLSTNTNPENKDKMLTLGFLDIYGFEVLKSNSLEQLFINYTNERLHQIYLHKIFKLEKNVFEEENLEHKWRQIQFEDNIKVIELLDYDNLSILNLLDEESAVASPDESSFITKLRSNHKKHEKFPPANFNLLSTQFMIRHTPQDIQYNVTGFKEKNKDLLREEIKLTLSSSKLEILRVMFSEEQKVEDNNSKTHKVRKYLSSKFRKEMNELVNGLLSKSEQHFIRCIKSNGEKKPLEIDQEIVYSQIKYLGILDTIKIKKMGFSVKIKYEDIDKRYPWVVRKSMMEPANINDIVSSLKSFLPRFGDEEILFGKTKVFFKEYSHTILKKKYEKYLEMLNTKAHKITSFLISLIYLKKKEKKREANSSILRYLKSFSQILLLQKRTTSISLIQSKIREFLSYKKMTKKMDSLITLQSYIKRNIQSRIKQRKIHFLKSVICKLKYLRERKRLTAKVVAGWTLDKVILDQAWKKVVGLRVGVVERYVQGFKVQIFGKEKIKKAMVNEKYTLEGKSLESLECYLSGFYEIVYYHKFVNKVKDVQNHIRMFLARREYKKMRNKIVLVQRVIKEYLFMKKGAKNMFETTYKSYSANVLEENLRLQAELYDTESSRADEVNSALKKFLGKFKEKISLLYYVIDIEAFVDLTLVYPNYSWSKNYLEVFHEGLERNDPLQYISVGETFTVAANTTKMYLWGMHDSYRNISPESISQIKTKMPVEFFEITKNKLNFSYVKEDDKKAEPKTFKICSTVAKDYNLENGKIYECLQNEIVLIKGIPTNERVVEISCGKAHTILRSSSKRVYTFGYGREGQLGHGTYNSEENPRLVKFFENCKPFYPIQVSASFTSSLVLLSNRKLFWFGKNGTISDVPTPILFNLRDKCDIFNNADFSIVRILPSWSRTMSLTGITVACFNGHFSSNLALRNKTLDVLFGKWQEKIQSINPPVVGGVSDHLEQCHVRRRGKKVVIQPESRETLKAMESKARSFTSLEGQTNEKTYGNYSIEGNGGDFSFANTQKYYGFK